MTTLTATLTDQHGIPYSKTIDVTLTEARRKAWLTIDIGNGKVGVHVYWIRDDDGHVDLGLRVSNGCVRADGTGFGGRIYYQSFTLTLDRTTIRVVKQGQHVLPPRAILERRYTIAPNGTVRRGWDYAIVIPNPADPFGPARQSLPPVDRDYYGMKFGGMTLQLQDALANGSKCTLYPWGNNGPAPAIDLRAGALGAHNPDGYPEDGAPAGYGIDLDVGWEQCTEALEFSALAHECAMDRNPVACYDVDTGAIVTCTDWTTNYLAHPQIMGGEPSPQHNKLELPAFFRGSYPNFYYPNANTGTCPYQSVLEAYQPDNLEHLIRAMRRAKVLAEAQDPMAVDDLAMLFEHHRTMSYGDRTDDVVGVAPAAGGGYTVTRADGSTFHAGYVPYIPPSLSFLSYFTGQNPGHGGKVLRSLGWMADAGAWGNASLGWARMMIDTYLAMGDKFGLPQREPHLPYIPAGWSGTQHFHCAIIHCGMWTLSRAYLYREKDVLDRLNLWRSSVLQNPTLPLEEREPGKGGWGPPKWIFTQGPNGEVDGLTTANASPDGFAEHVLATLGRAAQSARESTNGSSATRILSAGLPVEYPAPNLETKRAQMKAKTGDLSQYATYWAELEEEL